MPRSFSLSAPWSSMRSTSRRPTGVPKLGVVQAAAWGSTPATLLTPLRFYIASLGSTSYRRRVGGTVLVDKLVATPVHGLAIISTDLVANDPRGKPRLKVYGPVPSRGSNCTRSTERPHDGTKESCGSGDRVAKFKPLAWQYE